MVAYLVSLQAEYPRWFFYTVLFMAIALLAIGCLLASQGRVKLLVVCGCMLFFLLLGNMEIEIMNSKKLEKEVCLEEGGEMICKKYVIKSR